MDPRDTQKTTRAIRPRGNLLRTSQRPCPRESMSGLPIGQENSTSLMSVPITFRSASRNPKSHSRTGSRPLSER